jgi:predicted protein tyrosine phosphatase
MSSKHRVPPTFVPFGRGALALGPRLGKHRYPALERAGCTAVMTLLSATEDLERIREAIESRAWTWIWMPLRGGDPPAPERDDELRARLDEAVAAIREGARLYVHCAAGLHRTGMIASALLLLLEGPEVDLVARIHEMRPETAAELREDRVAWARRITALDQAAKPATILGMRA